jgi:hypothetical protein
MGVGGGKGAPAPPDFTAAATPTQNTPWATSSWSQGPSTPTGSGHWEGGLPGGSGHYVQDMTPGKMQQHVGLNPQLDQANQSMMGQLGSSWGTPLDNGQQARQHAEDAIYGRATSRLDPMWQQREHDLQTQLANQGIDPSSMAYQKQIDNMNRGRNDAYGQASYESILGGGQEAQRQQGMDLQSRMAPLAGMAGLQGLSGNAAKPAASGGLGAVPGGAPEVRNQSNRARTRAMGGLLMARAALSARRRSCEVTWLIPTPICSSN